MNIMLAFSHDEIQREFAYKLIYTTRECAAWQTMRRKLRWKNEFSDSERNAATRIFKQARDWYLVHGVPETATMSIQTYRLWQKLERFCASF